MAGGDYRAFSVRALEPSGLSVLHLVREDSETSLCGIPRSALGPGATSGELVCPGCVDWLPKRAFFSESSGELPLPNRARRWGQAPRPTRSINGRGEEQSW